MPEEWKIERRRGACAVCGRVFAPGDAVHAAIFEAAAAAAPAPAEPAADASSGPAAGDQAAPAEGPAFLRRDYCEACWPEAPSGEAFSCWRSVVPEPRAKDEPAHRRIDLDAARDFFRRLEGSAEPAHVRFRYILALILVRKKALRFTDVVRAEGREHLVLEEPGENVRHKVLDPGLDEEDMAAARRELGPLLGLPDEETAAEAPGSPDAGEPGEAEAE